MLPTFIVIGAKKAGTTSLYRHLLDHPAVWLPESKRIEFFSTARWELGTSWYEDQFARGRRAPARGEISTSYTRFPIVPDVPARMRAVVPDVRLLYLVRDPLERIESHYRHLVVEGSEMRPIDVAVLANPAEYIARSRYHLQVTRYLEHFPREQLLLLTTEALRDDPGATLSQVYAFLGVDPAHRPRDLDVRANRTDEMRREGHAVRRLRRSRPYRAVRQVVPAALRHRGWTLTTRVPDLRGHPGRLSLETRATVLDRLRPDIVELAALMPPSFDGWGLLDARA